MSGSTVEMAKARRAQASLWKSQARRDQLFFAALGVACLSIAGVLHHVMDTQRGEKGWNLVRNTPEIEKSYRSAAAAFPRLTLGGFRGVLSAALWAQAEDDKNERRWLDLETKYDIIGSLQPYFVSVYVFHAWNQSYNLSAQFQEQDTKYKWVLDGLGYLYKGEEYNPGAQQLYLEEGNLYMLKLGGAFERDFYRAHWRDDLSRLHDLNDLKPEDLNKQNMATQALALVRRAVSSKDRAYFNVTELPDPAKQYPGTGWGIEIRDPEPTSGGRPNLFKNRADHRPETDPVQLRWGVSVFYFAYCEFNRALAASTRMEPVNDSRPAMCLRLWCRDDCYYINDITKGLFLDKTDDDLKKNRDVIDRCSEDVQQCKRNVAMIGPTAVERFTIHLGKYPMNKNIHTKHMRETEAIMAATDAEADLFTALVKWQLAGRKMTPEVLAAFNELPAEYEKAAKVSETWVDSMYPVIEGSPVNPDRFDSLKYSNALKARAGGVARLLKKDKIEPADLTFLEDEVVEK